MFKKIIAFFKSLFSKKEKDIKEEPQEETACTCVSEVETCECGVEDCCCDESDEEKCFECKSKTFSDDDKSMILDILRPIIKNFNSDEFYINLCNVLMESKVLKTFSDLSDDGKELTIKLTQNNTFNGKIADFIEDHVITAFRSSIDAEMFGKFEVSAAEGSIIIKKVG